MYENNYRTAYSYLYCVWEKYQTRDGHYIYKLFFNVYISIL